MSFDKHAIAVVIACYKVSTHIVEVVRTSPVCMNRITPAIGAELEK